MRFTVSKKLAVLPAIGIAALGLSTVTALRTASELSHDTHVIAEAAEAMAPLADARDNVTQTSRALEQWVAAVSGERVLDDAETTIGEDMGRIRDDLDAAGSHASPEMAGAIDSIAATVEEFSEQASVVETGLAEGRVDDAALARYERTADELEETLASLVGDLRLEAAALDADADATVASERTVTLVVFVVLGAVLVACWRWIAGALLRPLRNVVSVLEVAAHGDLRPRVQILPDDEVGDMGHSLNATLDSLGATIGQVMDHTGSVSASSEELTAVAAQLASVADETALQATTVSSAATEVSASVSSVATGADEMISSIEEIARHASAAASVSEQATRLAQASNDMVAKLADSSGEIGDVVRTITSIAEQTNLLALNATIESARAGEAGKGFAVVADEVKQLAGATAKATADIVTKIDAIQADTRAAIDAIGGINSIIAQVSESQTTIASAVEEQTAATNEIGRSVSEAATGTDQIAENIDGMASAAREVSTSAGHTRSTATELSELAAQLSELVGRFQI